MTLAEANELRRTQLRIALAVNCNACFSEQGCQGTKFRSPFPL